MSNTYNTIEGSAYADSGQAGRNKMQSIYASEVTKQEIWPKFTEHFKSVTTKASYHTDICEIMNYFRKDFLQLGKKEAKVYYEWLQHKVKQGEIQPGTMAKKFRELHSFAEYICENKESFQITSEYEDYYYPYLRMVAKQEQFVKSVPVEHIDRLLHAAEEDKMAYCILVLLHRAGLSSTEITALRAGDLVEYADGRYAQVSGRKEVCYIPEDAADIVRIYCAERKENPYLFYNQRGNQLNTMYISRMMKKYTRKAGIPGYSAENIRNTCGVTLFAYGAEKEQVAGQLGVTPIQIRRYQNLSYRGNLLKEANQLVKLRVDPPAN